MHSVMCLAASYRSGRGPCVRAHHSRIPAIASLAYWLMHPALLAGVVGRVLALAHFVRVYKRMG